MRSRPRRKWIFSGSLEKAGKKALTFLATASLCPWTASAYEYHGRITFGGYASSETFNQSLDGSNKNDFATASTRFFFEADRVGAQDFQFLCDLRDKHDFFDLLDKERLTLTANNTFQLRQLNLRLPGDSRRLVASVGRFAIPEAGSVFTDGAELGWKWSPSVTTSIFGGLNPKRPDQTYVQFNPDSQVYGAYLLYQPNYRSWETSYYLSDALVANQVSSELDRLFWYHQMVIQPNPENRITMLSYLDFVPRVYIQNANLSYSHDFSRALGLSAGISAIDVIEYTRRQNIRETLAPSPYRDASLRGIYRFGDGNTFELSATHGVRLSDGFWKRQYLSRFSMGSLFNRRVTAYVGPGAARNFVSSDVLLKAGVGYYSDRWELTLDETLAWENYDSGVFLRPWITDLTLAHFFSKALYGTFSFENAADTNTTITSAFFKIGYRFGTREAPPLRDGAPPRGGL